MGLPLKFRTQWAKTKNTQARLEEAIHQYDSREEGYREEGIPFSERIQARLRSSIQYWKKVRANQSAELLRLHTLMLQNGDPVDPTFDRDQYEGYIRG